MLSRMPIRKKILCATLLLTCTLMLLLFGSLRGVYAYRQLAQMISQRAAEIPMASKLQMAVDDLRIEFRLNDSKPSTDIYGKKWAESHILFRRQLDIVSESLAVYENAIGSRLEDDPLLADRSAEAALVNRIRDKLQQIRRDHTTSSFLTGKDLDELGEMVHELPTFLQQRMVNFREEVRARYRTWIFIISFSAGASFVIVGLAYWFFRRSVVQPFKTLLQGSRDIAGGKFEHRIRLQSHDELAELASALNEMTNRFMRIRENLNEQVRERTREVVRSEQLASVGFLAAGVAHEINNPLASIAWSAEALESRLHEILHTTKSGENLGDSGETKSQVDFDQAELDVLRKYLKRIQDEAFRVKGITERLLDFSRLGETARKQETDLHESITDVIALVQHLGQYRNKRIEFRGQAGLLAEVNPPEFKQVVLNLLTNALDSLDPGGLVTVLLEQSSGYCKLTVQDNGCGMSEEVLQHLYEPFFTRRRDGRGTGLGLSITYRIVQDHAGELLASSDGPGQGSKFVLNIPLQQPTSKNHESIQRAA